MLPNTPASGGVPILQGAARAGLNKVDKEPLQGKQASGEFSFLCFSSGVRKSMGRGAEKEISPVREITGNPCHPIVVFAVRWWQSLSPEHSCFQHPYFCSSALSHCEILMISCCFSSVGNALGLLLWECVEPGSFPPCFCNVCEMLCCRVPHTPWLVHSYEGVFQEPAQSRTRTTPGILEH